ncbi:hypothetical protein Tco_0416259, partial [Tanacetum coccineum]
TASELGSTAGVKAKDKGKAIMQESEPLNKVKKRVQVQMSMDEELAKKVFEEEQAKAMQNKNKNKNKKGLTLKQLLNFKNRWMKGKKLLLNLLKLSKLTRVILQC